MKIPSRILDDRRFRNVLKRATVALCLAVGLPVLGLLTLVLIQLNAASWVNHTDRVIAQTSDLHRHFYSLQASFRGYCLLGNQAFLDRFQKERLELVRIWPEFYQLMADNPHQVAQVRKSQEASERWFQFVDAELKAIQQEPAVRDSQLLVRGVPIFDEVISQLEKVVEVERTLLTERSRNLDRIVTTLLTALGLAGLIGIPALVFWLQRLLRGVTASYRASLEAEQRRATELAVTLKSIGDAVIATSEDAKIIFLNPVAESLTGWSDVEAKGRHLSEVFPILNEQTREAMEDPVARVLREDRIVGLANHTVLRTRDGREIPIEDSAAPIRAEDGRVIGVILVFRDVMEKRAGEEKLRESEHRLRFLNDLNDLIRGKNAPTEIMAETTRLLGRQLQASRCAYAEVAQDGENFTIFEDYTDGCNSTQGSYQLSRFGPRALKKMHGGATLVVKDIEAEIPEEEGRAMFEAIGVKAIVCQPLVKEGKLRAMMAVHQTEPRQWTTAEIALVDEVVQRSWAIIERARAEAEARDRTRLSLLRAEVAGRLGLAEPLDQTLQGCSDLLARHLDAPCVAIWIQDEAEGMLVRRGRSGEGCPTPEPPIRVWPGEGMIGLIASTREPCFALGTASGGEPIGLEWGSVSQEIAFAGYPLLVEESVIGVAAIFTEKQLSDAALADLSPLMDAVAQQVQRKRAEAALNASETLKSAILETSLDGFIMMDHEGFVLDANPAFEKIFGWSKEDLIGNLLADFIIPARLREAHRQGLTRYIETREARLLGRRLELPALNSSGTEFPCELSISHIADTEPPLFAGYVRDITDRKTAEAALEAAMARAEASAREVAEAAERFRLLSEVVALQVWTATPDGGLDFANSEVGEYFGVEIAQEVLGDAWAQFVHPEDLPQATEAWRNSVRSGEPYETEFRLRRADGQYRWFLTRAEAMRDAAGHVQTWFGINTDIHALKLAQSEADRASRAKDDFLAVLSHELRTPLTPVLMAAAALGQDDRLPDEVRAQLGMMERNIGLEARLIDDLLDITRISKGKLPLRQQLCDAHSLIGLAVEIVRDDAQAKNITLDQDFGARLSGVMTDPSRFQQVIWNLLRNAVKFTPAEGMVTIHTRDVTDAQGGHRLCVEVRDSGIGIEPEAIERIFHPFEQAGLTGDHRFGGIGLGLAIARAIVDLHGGTISAESDGANRGAAFIVELPGATQPPSGMNDSFARNEFFLPGQPEAVEEESDLVPLKLLVVEDHAPTLQVLERLLVRAGHHVVAATSVKAALAAAATETFHGVISDLGLPDGTGNGLMEKLRELHGLRGIALTGYGMEEDLERSRLAGFVMHLIKPIDFNQLRRAIAIFRQPSE